MGRLNDQKKEARKVVGIDSISGLPREEVISAYVVNEGIANCVNQIAAEMKSFLERTPPQIAYHIAKEGIYLTGGSTRLPYIDNYLASYTGFALIFLICMKLLQHTAWKRSSATETCANGPSR